MMVESYIALGLLVIALALAYFVHQDAKRKRRERQRYFARIEGYLADAAEEEEYRRTLR